MILTFPTLVPDSTTGTDYINAFYNPNTALNMATIARTTAGTFPSPVVVPAPTTAAPALNLYPRLPLGASSTAGAATGTIPPENESCLATEYCTVVSWTGPTATTNDPDTKTLTVLVVRDSVAEGQEEFRVKLNNLNGPLATYGAIRDVRGRIQNDNQTAACGGISRSNNDDHEKNPNR